MRKLLYIALIFGINSCGAVDHNELNLSGVGVVNIGILTKTEAEPGISHTTSGAEIGLFLCNTLNLPHSLPEDINIKAKFIKNMGWEYYYQSSSDKLSQLSLDKNGGNLNCYAYSPFNSSVADIKNIDFTTSSQLDLMWAVSGKSDESSNIGISLDSDNLTIPLKFKRAMSLLKFQFKLKNSQNSVILSKISFESTGTSHVYLSGVLDATNGLLSENIYAKESEELSFDINKIIPSNITETLDENIIFVPTTIDNIDGIDIYLTINGKKLTKPIKILDIVIEAGSSYTLDVTIDNYAKLTGISVDETWGEYGDVIEI